MATAAPQPQPHHHGTTAQEAQLERPPDYLIIFGHSNFFYWWPVWAVGYLMAVVTRLSPENQVTIGDEVYFMSHSRALGVIYTFVLVLVILMTNVHLRGLWSAVTILVVLVGILLAAYFNLWGTLLDWFGRLDIYMNMGFYVFFSTLIFLFWLISTLIFDRMEYWKLTPGQLTHEFVVGGAAKSYDTRGMVFEKVRQDLFRQWILGLGSADLKISTMGAHRETMQIHNVLWADAKVRRIQQLIAEHQQFFVAAPPA